MAGYFQTDRHTHFKPLNYQNGQLSWRLFSKLEGIHQLVSIKSVITLATTKTYKVFYGSFESLKMHKMPIWSAC